MHVGITEHLSLQLLRDGGLASFDLKGELELLVSDPALAKVKLALIAPSSSASFAADIQFKNHPNVLRFAPSGPRVVALKDAKRSFPVGQGLGVVKWKLGGTKESQVPLGINCWPSAGEGNVEVNIEYELEAKHLTLRDVCISIPIPCVPPPPAAVCTLGCSRRSPRTPSCRLRLTLRACAVLPPPPGTACSSTSRPTRASGRTTRRRPRSSGGPIRSTPTSRPATSSSPSKALRTSTASSPSASALCRPAVWPRSRCVALQFSPLD